MCASLCHCLCYVTFYISLAPGPRKESDLCVLLLGVSPNHSTYRANSSSLRQILTLYSPLSSLIFPARQENVPCSSALWCQNEKLLSGWAGVFERQFWIYKFWPHSHPQPQERREKPLCSLTCSSLPQPLNTQIRGMVFCTYSVQEFTCDGRASFPGMSRPHHLSPACVLQHVIRSETGKLL